MCTAPYNRDWRGGANFNGVTTIPVLYSLTVKRFEISNKIFRNR
jgi:hypothetical protein